MLLESTHVIPLKVGRIHEKVQRIPELTVLPNSGQLGSVTHFLPKKLSKPQNGKQAGGSANRKTTLAQWYLLLPRHF